MACGRGAAVRRTVDIRPNVHQPDGGDLVDIFWPNWQHACTGTHLRKKEVFESCAVSRGVRHIRHRRGVARLQGILDRER